MVSLVDVKSHKLRLTLLRRLLTHDVTSLMTKVSLFNVLFFHFHGDFCRVDSPGGAVSHTGQLLQGVYSSAPFACQLITTFVNIVNDLNTFPDLNNYDYFFPY